MRPFLALAALLAFIVPLHSQSNDNLFEESFSNMFNLGPDQLEISQNVGMPDSGDPSVPLDGGLTALLVAGGAVGYRKYRARSTKR